MSDTSFHCDEYNCIVNESPCPYCGSDDHEGASV